MRNCPKCNVQVLDDEAKFCIECGASLNVDVKPSEPVPVKPPEKNKSSAVSLKKGQRTELTKTNPSLKKLLIGLGWDTNKYDGGYDFDLDAAAFLLGANGKVTEETDFIFYNNPIHYSDSVEHLSDNLTGAGDGDDEEIRIDLSKIPNNIAKVAFTVTIHEAEERQQSFGQVSNAFIRIVDETSGKEILRYDLSEDFSAETAIVVAEIYRYKGEWKFNAVGAGFNGGLVALCNNFGISVN